MAYYVQVYSREDLNAPPISGQMGTAIVVLNACLVDGYGWSGMSIIGITRSGSTATATISASDGLKIQTGNILTISGANETEYNGTFEITVTSTTTFTYTISGTPSTPASGTITCDNFLRIVSIARGGEGNKIATVTTLNNNLTHVTGDMVKISGCTGTGNAQYNGTFRITVLGSKTFTYEMASDPGANASGNPVYTKPGLQWTRPFAAGTNSQTYISQATVGAMGEEYIPRYLQVNDNGTPSNRGSYIYGAEIMESNNVVLSGRFPTVSQRASGGMLAKSYDNSTIQRGWILWGDEKTFSFATQPYYGNRYHAAMSFGYIIPYKNGEKFNTHISCCDADSIPSNTGLFYSSTLGYNGIDLFYLCRNFTQIGSSSESSLALCYTTTASLFSFQGLLTHPNVVDNSIYIQPVFVNNLNNLYGKFPGIYGKLSDAPLTNKDIITNVVGFPVDKQFLHLAIGNNNYVSTMIIDRFGPWT